MFETAKRFNGTSIHLLLLKALLDFAFRIITLSIA